MGQQRVSRVAVCLLAALSIGRAAPIEAEDLPPQLSSPEQDQRVIQQMQEGEAKAATKAGEDLYRRGEYALAADQLDSALAKAPGDPEALMFAGLVEVRRDQPGKAAAAWGRLQEVTTDERLRQDVGRMRTILLREQSERAAREAVAAEQRLRAEPGDARTVAVATFRNAGSAEYQALGKALAAMLIDNLSALPGIRVLEREQVQALEEEAKLSGTGLVESGTAVRAGKLLRAGRVTAGSHANWTASPMHLRLDALLVDVNAGTTMAGAKSEALASEFFKLVPAVATAFAGALNRPASGLETAARQKLEEEHTHNPDAALAFGRALDGLDRHDAEAARQACKEAESADPNFQLAKLKCAFVPLTWLSMQGVAKAMEPTALAMAGVGAATTSLTVPIVAGVGVLAAGAIAGGVYAATSGGGGGGGGGENGGNVPPNNAPQITAVSDRTVSAGQTAAIDVTCRDPDGTATTITNPNPPPGSTFSQTSGNPATGRYRQRTNASEVGQSFAVRFDCSDSGSPPGSTSQGATIRVVQQAPPTPTPQPQQPTPAPCRQVGADCNSASQCCGGQCTETFATPNNDICCLPEGASCNPDNDLCCTTPRSIQPCDCPPASGGPGLVCCPPIT
ncbi:MAG: CsgG/HfaB family protein [Candidatus Binatia bacterium]